MPGTLNDTWHATLLTLMGEYISIEVQNDEAKFIQSGEFEIQTREYQEWADQLLPASHGYGAFELHLTAITEKITQLQIAARFQAGKHGIIQNKGRHYSSTGIFESRIASRIHDYLVLYQYPELLQIVTGCNFRWDDPIGYYRVSGVAPMSFGEEQGFQNGDIVVSLSGIPMNMENFFGTLTQIRETSTHRFFVDRNGEGIYVDAEIIFLPEKLPQVGIRVARSEAGSFFVSEVMEDSPGETAGFQVGDILLEEEGVPITSWRNYFRGMTKISADKTRDFSVSRAGAQAEIVVNQVAA
jgi:membrane-associated protease RseP (regulator of RpoE activity)